MVDVAFLTPRDGLAITLSGGIWRTSDAGYSWSAVADYPDLRLAQIRLRDRATGMILGLRGCVARRGCAGPVVFLTTVDSGVTWRSVVAENLPVEPNSLETRLNLTVVTPTVAFLNPDTTHTSGGPIDGIDTGLWRTDDSGRTWRALPYGSYGGLDFLTPERGFMTSGTAVLRTDDGGSTWRSIYSHEHGKDEHLFLRAVQFLDDRHGIVGGGWKHMATGGFRQFLAMTDDGGSTWRTVDDLGQGVGSQPISRLRFTTTSTGWVAHGGCAQLMEQSLCSGRVRYTEDGGRTWTGVSPRPAYQFSSVGASAWFVDRERAVLGGALLYHTADAGDTWQPLRRPEAVRVQAVYFLSATTGCLLTNVGRYLTTDGGQTWRPAPLAYPAASLVNGSYSSYRSVKMVGPNLVFAAFQRRDGYRLLTELHRSTDSGRTWRPVERATPGGVMAPSIALSFADERHGWLVVTSRDQTELFRTADGGLTWQLLGNHPIISSVIAYAEDMTATGLSFASERRGAALAATGPAILLTDDGGQTWRRQPLPVNGRFVTYTPAGDIWLVSGENLLHSADGGLTWQSHQVMMLDHGGGITSPAGWRSFNHQPLRFLTLSRGWSALSDGTLVVTDDGGHTWRQVWPVLPYLVPAP